MLSSNTLHKTASKERLLRSISSEETPTIPQYLFPCGGDIYTPQKERVCSANCSMTRKRRRSMAPATEQDRHRKIFPVFMCGFVKAKSQRFSSWCHWRKDGGLSLDRRRRRRRMRMLELWNLM